MTRRTRRKPEPVEDPYPGPGWWMRCRECGPTEWRFWDWDDDSEEPDCPATESDELYCVKCGTVRKIDWRHPPIPAWTQQALFARDLG